MDVHRLLLAMLVLELKPGVLLLVHFAERFIIWGGLALALLVCNVLPFNKKMCAARHGHAHNINISTPGPCHILAVVN